MTSDVILNNIKYLLNLAGDWPILMAIQEGLTGQHKLGGRWVEPVLCIPEGDRKG